MRKASIPGDGIQKHTHKSAPIVVLPYRIIARFLHSSLRRVSRDCTWEVANNILWGNEGIDLHLQTAGTVLRCNDLDDLGGSSPPASSNGIEGFWSYAKNWLYPYRGVPSQYFHLYLAEVCYRFNHREQDLKPLLFRLLKITSIQELRPILVRKA